jgi:hypothetical protein
MTWSNYGGRRAFLVLLLLCVTVLAQSSALAAQSETHHSTDHCCLLCHVGPLAMLQTSVTVSVAPVFQMVWMTAAADFQPTHDVLLNASSSRAPPAA